MTNFNGYTEAFVVASAMIKYGGSFVENLGRALQCADMINTQKIRDTWPEYWQQYLEIAERMPMFTDQH